MKGPHKIGSLFSGVGGIELGFESEGFQTEWFIENDRYAREVLKKRWPAAFVYEDITKVDFRSVPKVDILTGGFPCQDISNAGKRVGIKGSRSSLWKYYLEAIRIIRPRISFIENVSAILGRGLDVVLADLASIGYDAEWHCLSASSVGANHQRDRLFIIAYSDSDGCERFGQEMAERCDTYKEYVTKPESTDVSNSDSTGSRLDEFRDDRNRAEKDKERGWEQRVKSIEGCKDVPYSSQPELERSWEEGIEKPQSYHKEEESMRSIGYWTTEPELGRVAHGVSNRVDRIKCLGNAVVPQVAQVFAKAIKEIAD